VSLSVLRYIKQNSTLKRTISHRNVKNSSRFITYEEIKNFLLLIGYDRIQTNFWKSSISEFKNSSFVQSSNKEGIVLKPQSELFKENHHIYSTLVLKPETKYDSFTYNKFINFSAEFLYSIPQATPVIKGASCTIQPIAQDTVAKYLNLTQTRIHQIHKLNRKVYIYAEIDEHSKNQANYFGDSYTREVQKLGFKEDGSYKPSRIFKLVGTKLMGTLNFKSFVRGETKKSNKVQQKKLPGLAQSNKGEYKDKKLRAPKQHSKIDKQGLLVGFKTHYMRNNDVTSHLDGIADESSYQENKVKTFQIVAYNRESSTRKLDVQVRIDSLYRDIKDFKLKYKIRDTEMDFYYHSFEKRINLAGSIIASLYYKGNNTGYLRRNFNLLKFKTHKEISKYITYKQNHSKYTVDLNDKGETEYTLKEEYKVQEEKDKKLKPYEDDNNKEDIFLKVNRIKHVV